ncbi:MAG: hypothetical protein LBB56_03170 [Chitinispirillales bacterium]|jgi:hypothetical protein|nr:hypothetical protein [Chitinispirillales bacterium]
MIQNLNSNPLSANTKQESGLMRATVVRQLDGDGGYLLRAHNGREFAVRVDANTGLTAGQNVLVNHSEGKIVILPDNSSPDTSQLLKQLPADIFSKSEQPAIDKNSANETNVQANQKNADFAVSPDKIFADGIYKINSAKNIELTDKILREISGEAKDYAAVRLSSVNGQQIISAVTSENLQKVIEEIHTGFASSVMRSLPPVFFEQIFSERGELNLDSLKTLDTQLQNRNLPIDPASQFQLEKLSQWVRLMLDNPQLIEKAAERIPVTDAQETARQFQLLNAMSANFLPDIDKGSLLPEKFFLTEEKLLAATGLNRSILIENLCTSAFSSAPSKLLEVLEKLESSGQTPVTQTTADEARQIVSEFLSKFPTVAYKELEMVHDSNRFSPKVSEAQTTPAPQPEPPKQAVPPQALIRTALSELTEAAVKTLLDGNAKETAALICAKIASFKEIISQIQPPTVFNDAEAQKVIPSEIKTDAAIKNTGNFSNPDKIENTQRTVSNEIKADVLMKIADNLEKAVLSFSSGLNKGELDSGQKAALLTIIQTSVSSANSALPTDVQTYPFSQNFYDRLISMPKLQSGSEDANTLFSRITSAQESIQKLSLQLTNNVNGLDDKGAGNPLLNLTHKMWSETEKLRAGFQEVFSSLDMQNRVSVLESSNENPLLANRQSIDSFRLDLMMDVSRALQDIFSSVKELNTTASQIPENLRLPPDVENILRDIVRNIEQQTNQSSELLTEKLKIVLRELTSMQAENTRAAAEQQNTDAKSGSVQKTQEPQNTQFMGADALKSAVQSAVRGLETLQLLSAQTRGAGETQQQIVALPVKIGEEWTEVHVKFLKEKKDSKKRSGDGHVSVYLNVAPSALGEVGAHLDFYPPANLKISFQFERTGTKKWFMDQSANIREALSEAGLPGTVLEFRSKRVEKMSDTKMEDKGKSRRKSGKIDIDA